MVKYSYYIARISSFIASKMQSSVTKNLVFPSCGDIKILQLMVCYCLAPHVQACHQVPRFSNKRGRTPLRRKSQQHHSVTTMQESRALLSQLTELPHSGVPLLQIFCIMVFCRRLLSSGKLWSSQQS